MGDDISRREWLRTVGAVGATGASGLLPPVDPLLSPSVPRRLPILPLVSTTEVFVPGRGRGFQKFSFDFPEPSVEFAGFRFGFRVFTRENIYAPDADRMTAEGTADRMTVSVDGLVWAGGQEKAEGRLTARFRKTAEGVEWDAEVRMDQPVKSVGAVIRGLPRGRISVGGSPPFDPRDDELLFGYPFGAGDLFGGNSAGGMGTPFIAVVNDQEVWSLTSLDDKVRAKRFYFQPGEIGYRVEALFEAEGWLDQPRLSVPAWRLARTTSLDAATERHYAHLERAYRFPAWETRADVPAWLRKTALVLSLHGAHYTGFVFNDFARMLEILKWTATQIPAERVLVFLPAWDGRYYWNYPLYRAVARMGGEEGLKRLIREGQALGFRFMPMFGMNTANRRHPEFAKFADAATQRIDGDQFDLDWVDWDNDRHQEGWVAYLNLGVDSWRRWLTERIGDVIERYGADAFFLDISGGWVNNRKADMHEGTRRLVADLRAKYPAVLACGEFPYDALMEFLPLFHVYSKPGMKYARFFSHLSHPAPGRGSSGVHEAGFGRFNEQTLSIAPGPIPTISVVEDTFTRHRDTMAAAVAKAKELGGIP
ncbi:MAG TPA: hypothetical protein VFU23_02465 [Gemmatimonadales bacterium]|nr:hypothetical protein [Gemmatimonadales bacterium]